MLVLLLAILALLVALVVRADASPLAPVGGTMPTADDAAASDDAAAGDDDLGDLGDEAPPGAAAVRRGSAGDVAAAKAPPVSAVVAAAYRAAGLDSDPAPAWRRRARLAGLVPTFTVRDGRDAAWRDVSDPTIAYVSVFSVAATWHLERLMFDPNELRISAIEAGRRRDRRRVAALAIRSYFAWLHGRGDEAQAELDALTDGWFSDAVSRNLPPGTPADQAVGK